MSVLAPLLLLMAVSPIRADHVLVEGFANNMAVGRAQPLVEWRVADPRPGAKQSAFQIQINGEGLTYESPQIKGDTGRFEYFGQPLSARQDYSVRVRLWDHAGEAGEWSTPTPFRTLRLAKDWPAQWIQAPVNPPPFQKPQNGFHSVLETTPSKEKWAEIDLGTARTIDRIILHPSEPIDWTSKTPGFLFPMQFRVEVDGKTVATQTTDLEMHTQAYVVPFTPVVGTKVKLVLTKLRERNPGHFGWSLAELEVAGGDAIHSLNAKVSASDGLESQLWSVKNLTDGDLKSHPALGTDALPAQMLRKTFELDKVPARSLVHVAVLGAYELFVNGKRVDRHALSPDWTDYFIRVGVQTFDITKFLKVGKNSLSALVGDSWYAGRLGMSQSLHPEGRPRGVYGRVPMMRAEIELPTGSVLTDTTWKTWNKGPVMSSDHLDGEVYDATKQVVGWTNADFDDSGWTPARVGVPVSDPGLDVQTAEPVSVTREVKPIKQHRDKKGNVVLDFGQNLVGRARFMLEGKAGDKVVVRYVEMLNDDGSAYFANLRGAPQIDTFILDGTKRWYTTHFTYHGFRYASVETTSPTITAVAEVFHTSAPETSLFTCSNPMFERLWQNVVWTQRANLMSTPTDCPQRDERLGWMGDIHAYAQTASYIMDMRNFWRKWLLDVQDAQADDGRFADFSPHPYGKNDRFTGVPGWGDAGVIAPLSAYRNYEDLRAARESLPSAARWLTWIESKNPNFLWEKNRHNDYGDWLNGDTLIQEGWPKQGAECPKDVFATLMWFQSAKAAEEMALALNVDSLDATLQPSVFTTQAAKVQAAFLKAYVDADGKIKGDTQAGYAIALGLDILPQDLRSKAFAHLLKAIERAKNHISTGFHSTHHLMQVLTRFGRSDVAYMLLSNKTFPGWGYSIEQGATTIWERWDGFVKGRGFQDPGMNSFNHWAFGSVGEWMMESIIGIKIGEPGWRKFSIAPQIGGDLTWAKGHFDAPTGRISVSWKVTKNELEIDVKIPANTEASFKLPQGWTGDPPPSLSAGEHKIRATRS